MVNIVRLNNVRVWTDENLATLRTDDVARRLCHKISFQELTKNYGPLTIIERILLRIVIGSKILL